MPTMQQLIRELTAMKEGAEENPLNLVEVGSVVHISDKDGDESIVKRIGEYEDEDGDIVGLWYVLDAVSADGNRPDDGDIKRILFGQFSGNFNYVDTLEGEKPPKASSRRPKAVTNGRFEQIMIGCDG